jgi:hypothetical protein
LQYIAIAIIGPRLEYPNGPFASLFPLLLGVFSNYSNKLLFHVKTFRVKTQIINHPFELRTMRPNNQTPLQQFMAATMANYCNTAVLVSDSAKTSAPESFRKSHHEASSGTTLSISSPSRRRKMNPESCRWGEARSSEAARSSSSTTMVTARRRRSADSALVFPKLKGDFDDFQADAMPMLLLRKAPSTTPVLDDDYLDSKPILPMGGNIFSTMNPPQVKREILKKPTSSPRIIVSRKKLGPTSGSQKTTIATCPAKKGSSERTMDLKGQAIIETVIALSHKAAFTITRDQAMCSSRSAVSA